MYHIFYIANTNKNRQMEDEMEKKKPAKAKKPAFTTFPIADQTNIIADSKVAIPSDDAAKEAREWVNINKK